MVAFSKELIPSDIVISGIAGRFPNSRTVKEFGDNLFNKVDLIDDKPSRWKPSNPDVPQRAGKISDLDKFDAEFFGVHPSEAHWMDPQLRMLLEHVYEAIMDAGMNPKELAGTRTAVILATSYVYCQQNWTFLNVSTKEYQLTSTISSSIVHRIANVFDLKGPCFVVDTACSSSVIAIDRAMKSIRMTDCDSALVITANICPNPFLSMQFAKIGMLSPGGISRPFDEDVDGYVRAEAAAAILMQKAESARRAYCTIVHSKLNCDGFKEEGITYPSSKMQAQLMQEFYEEIDLDPREVTFLEAHTTGTPVGDPEECFAIQKVFCQDRKDPLQIGSIKSNMGHSEAAANLCSIAKILIGFNRGMMPPTINVKKINSRIPSLVEGRIVVPTENIPLNDNRLVAVNSFGFGGANGHVLLKGWTKRNVEACQDQMPRLVVWAGRNSEACETILREFESQKFNPEFFYLLNATQERAIRANQCRMYAVVQNQEGKVAIFKEEKRNATFLKRPMVWVFDQVENWRTLILAFNEIVPFKETIEKCEQILKDQNVSLKEILNRDETNLAGVLGQVVGQAALADTMFALGVRPNWILGNLFGDLVAGYASGCLTLSELVLCALRIGTLAFECELKMEQNAIFDIIKSVLKDFIPYKIAIWKGPWNRNIKDIDGLASYLSKSLIQRIELNEQHVKNSLLINFGDEKISETSRGMIQIALNSKESPMKSFLSSVGRIYLNEFQVKINKIFPSIELPVSVDTPMISPLIKFNHEEEYFWLEFEKLKEITPQTTGNIVEISIKDNTYSYFEGHTIDENDVPVVIGSVKILNRIKFAKMPKPSNVSSVILDTSSFYKELKLRGYNYHGEFRRVVESSSCGQVGKIRHSGWSGMSYVTFIDSMLQMSILQRDSRTLYLPTGIDRLMISPCDHEIPGMRHEKDFLFDVQVCKELNLIRAGGIEIQGVRATPVNRRRSPGNQVLERYIPVPLFVKNKVYSTKEAVRVFAQLTLENYQNLSVKVVEIDGREEGNLIEYLRDALDDLPLIKPELKLFTKREVEATGVQVDKEGNVEKENNCFIIIGEHLTSDLEKFQRCFGKCGFLISREAVSFSSNGKNTIEGFTIVSTMPIESETLVLIQMNRNTTFEYPVVIKVSAKDSKYEWLEQLKSSYNTKKIVIYAQNEPLSGILGLVNCIRREPKGSNVVCFFIADHNAPIFDLEHPVYQQQYKLNLAFNVYNNGEWCTYRHLLLEDTIKYGPQNVPCFVNILKTGDLSTLSWFEGDIHNIKHEEDPVSISYASLNFRDIMLATGRMSSDLILSNRLGRQFCIGFEYSGITRSGQRVMGLTNLGSIATYSVSRKSLMLKCPDKWTLEEAATVPVVYTTVYYAFFITIKIQKRKKILIHAGTGGIGLAAIQVAHAYGLEVFTTVSNKEKKQYLLDTFPQLKESHIGNSRDCSFYDMIMNETQGKGVDYVLNSFSGEKLIASLKCLSHGGNFLEIGKYDMAIDTEINLEIFEKGISFHAVLVDNLINSKCLSKVYPTLNKLFRLIESEIEAGIIQPLKRTIFQAPEVEQAFRYLASAKHIGKVLLKIRENEDSLESLPLELKPSIQFDRERSFIIPGGLGGFGVELADWLVLRGCRKLILSSSRGISTPYQGYRINTWKSYGVQVRVPTAPITTREGCEQLINEALTLGPVGGIFNLAVILRDNILDNQDATKYKEVMAPKADATMFLDELSRRLCPDLQYFIVFSSITSGRGSPGQTSYGMANSIMERVMEKRHADGLPAKAIQWGAVGEVGLVADMQKEKIDMVIGGMFQQRIASCLEEMDKLIASPYPIVASMVVAEKRDGLGSGNIVEDVLQILNIKDVKSVPTDSKLSELGMDSLMAVEIRQIVERDYGITLNAQDLRTLTIRRLQEISASKSSDTFEESKIEIPKLFQNFGDESTSNITIFDLKSGTELENNKSPILLVPGIEGLVNETWHTMAQNVTRPLFLLQLTSTIQAKTSKEIAEIVYPEVSELFKDSFLIGGYSFGAIPALELAAKLEASGKRGKILLIDGAPKYIQCFTNLQFPTGNDMHEMEIGVVVEVLKALKIEYAEELYFELNRRKTRQEKKQLLKERLKGQQLHYSDEFIEMIVDSITQRMAITLDLKLNEFPTIKSDVLLIKPSQATIRNIDEDYGLGEFVRGKINILKINADHTTIIENPEIVACLNEFEDKFIN